MSQQKLTILAVVIFEARWTGAFVGSLVGHTVPAILARLVGTRVVAVSNVDAFQSFLDQLHWSIVYHNLQANKEWINKKENENVSRIQSTVL